MYGRRGVSRFGALRWMGLALLSTFWVAGCECDDPPVSITLTEPLDGAELSLADDTNPDLEGVQITVRGQVMRLAVGDQVELWVDGTTASTTTVPEDGAVQWTNVTISSGTHTLQAATPEGDVTSQEITVTINDSCFAVSYVTPEPLGDEITFGPEDDTDGVACEDTFETTIIVSTAAPDGSMARIYVNDTPRRTATVSGGVVRFEDVAFDNRGDTANNMRVEVTNTEGISCDAAYPLPIFVDCDGPSCAITQPDTGTAYLSQSDDVSDADGFQGDFEVTTDAEGAGNQIRLIIDGDIDGDMSTTPDGMVATFGNVGLTEGLHRVVAECRDDAGNPTRSGVAEWTVDITPCDVALTTPTEGDLFIDDDDVDPSTTDIEIAVAGTAGADCDGLRVGQCPSIDSRSFGAVEEDWMSQATLSSSAMQEICAETADEAGNVNRASVNIRYNSDRPQLEIATPSSGAAFNIAGTAGRTADLMDGNNTCEALFEVRCTGVGEDVTLVRDDTSTTLGTATCVADASVPAPYTGLATFSMVSLPTVGTGASFPVVAMQTVDRLDGTSTAVSIQSDCVAPQLTVTRPMCGERLYPATQDEDTATAGFQYRTTVLNPTDPASDVTLTIQPAGGGAPVYMSTDTTTSTIVNFPNANYGMGGVLEIIATATDSGGNVGRNNPPPEPACVVTVEDIPTVTITAPGMGDVISTDQCSVAGGTGVQVTGTTDAAPGSTVDVTVDGVTTSGTVAGDMSFDLCAPAPDGRTVPILVEIIDSRGMGMATVTVVVDTMPPTTAIDTLSASIVDRRDGVVRFSWTAVEDAGGLTLSGYVMRCADTPITMESEWDVAGDVALVSTPGTAGSVQTEDVDGFRPGQTVYCVLRGEDPAGALTPLPASSTTVTIDFLEQVVTPPGSPIQFGASTAAVGDVTGDGIDDALVGAFGSAYLYTGSSTGLSSSPAVTFTSVATAFGLKVAGLGDINGDMRPDFAISAFGNNGAKGSVFIFYGRTSASAFPSTCDLDVGCPPDVVLNGDDGVAATGPDEMARFGWDVGSAGDFDGDGFMDIAVGAPNAPPGRAYVILGSSSLPSSIAVPGAAGSEPDGFVLVGGDPAAQMGYSVTSLGGDVTGEGRHDVVVGALGGGAYDGRALLVRGQDHTPGTGVVTLSSTTWTTIDMGTAGEYGAEVRGAGDVDGDGRLDLLVYDQAGAAAGRVWIYRGTTAGFGSSVFSISNDVSGAGSDRMGVALGLGRHPWLGAVGDIDADGLADVFFGSDEYGSADGAADFFYSESTLVDRVRTEASVSFQAAAGDGRRRAVAFVGDLDGDGFPDMGIGERDSGQFYIIH